MDIQKLFIKQAHLFLNSSLVVLIPATIFMLLNILIFSEEKLMILLTPFFVYSLFLFQQYLLNYRRFLVLTKKKESFKNEKQDIFSCNQIVLNFSKEEKELLFFHPNGNLLGKMIKKRTTSIFQIGGRFYPKEFLLVDKYGRVLAIYFGNSDTIDVYSVGKGYTGSFSFKKKGIFHLLSGEVVGTLRSETTFLDDQILGEKEEVVFRILKGWMPIKCQELFVDPNRPILTISPKLGEFEKTLYFSSLVKRFFH